ncbi:methionine ABC transporter ATP-binding protein [Salinibacterium sp. M195]|uniref:methionine ABC transporter ATP-binding protein n=1 Tax=Salinibacterium sp. M195 TaxID=2583374 RepID=UPI001C62D051|nr:methionine ABC transporter ATP-binding protein [Salinibacterium sp. M195]QYH36970.1 methionine ABC transporter ATP-binding protein [Salinibacterium sp. M195]
MTAIQLTNVSKAFPTRTRGERPVLALDDVSLTIEQGEIFGIIGYSGAGKSTLVRLINALERSSSGSILINGTEMSSLRERELRRIRLGIGMVFQQFNLFTSRTVWGNIAYPLIVAGVPQAEHQARISELLHFVGLADKAHSYPDQLSGGQKQRVGIARALATNPSILLADEATSALDPETTREVLAVLKRANEELGVTIVVITHEMEVIRSIAHTVAVMDAGRVVESGSVFDIFSAPQSETTKKFVSTVVKAIPEPAELAVLRDRHPGRIVTLSFHDGDATQSAVFTELASSGLAFELIYGGINEIQGRSFGHLTVSITGDSTAIDAALARVGALVTVTEVK